MLNDHQRFKEVYIYKKAPEETKINFDCDKRYVDLAIVELAYEKALKHHYTVPEMVVALRQYDEGKVMVALQFLLLSRRLILSHQSHLYKR